MRSLLLVAAASLIVFTSCQKEIGFDDEPTNPGGTLNTYLPLTAGTWWRYEDSATQTITRMHVGTATQTFENILFKAMIQDTVNSLPVSDTSWQSNVAPNYYMRGEANAQGTAAQVILHYLKENANVGETWTRNAGTVGLFTLTSTGTMIRKNFTDTVLGVSYPNTIHTNLKLVYTGAGMSLDLAEYNVYSAKGVGIIRIRTEINLMGMPIASICANLKGYQVN